MPRWQLPYGTVALVLQGGGALGAYQAGVYEGLEEAGIEPDWVAGISIGAFNSAIIAGNPPGKRCSKLIEFWETISRPAFSQPPADFLQHCIERLGSEARKLFGAFQAWRVFLEGQRGFFIPRLPPPWMATELPPEKASYYDNTQLKATLESLVDFDRINAGETRVSVSAVNVRTGNFEHFDNAAGTWKGKLRAEHFMASGALPPGFPPVEIEGEYYWDGGLVSNTPLLRVLQAWPRQDLLAFQVDLWSAKGVVPNNIWDVLERQKDIQYSSRTRAITDLMHREQRLRDLIRELLERVPPDRRGDSCCTEARIWATDRRVNVIHLVYRDKEWDGMAKDYEFDPLSMSEHWASGLEDIRHSLGHKEWLEPPIGGKSFVTHDLHRHREAGGD